MQAKSEEKKTRGNVPPRMCSRCTPRRTVQGKYSSAPGTTNLCGQHGRRCGDQTLTLGGRVDSVEFENGWKVVILRKCSRNKTEDDILEHCDDG